MTDASPPPRPWRRLDDLALAFVFLTRLPLRLPGAPPDGALARSMTWFPIVGAAVGVFGGSVYALAHFAGLSAASAALLALAATVWVTGALHEDGLADTFDGLGGGRDRARKLAIMHDSRIGSYGALALLFSVGLRASALVAIAAPWTVLAAMVAAGSLSRVVAPVLAALLPPARTDGLGFLCGRPPRGEALAAVGIGLVVAASASGLGALPMLLAGTLAAAATVAAVSLRQIDGYTGDTLGAAQQACEAAVLLILSVTP